MVHYQVSNQLCFLNNDLKDFYLVEYISKSSSFTQGQTGWFDILYTYDRNKYVVGQITVYTTQPTLLQLNGVFENIGKIQIGYYCKNNCSVIVQAVILLLRKYE